MTKVKSQHNFYLSEETRRMLNTIKAFRGDATIDDTLAFIASTKIDEVLETKFGRKIAKEAVSKHQNGYLRYSLFKLKVSSEMLA